MNAPGNTAQTCKAPKLKTLRGIFGDRCGKPVVENDPYGRAVCAECRAWGDAARRDLNSVGSVLAEIYKRRVAEKKGGPP